MDPDPHENDADLQPCLYVSFSVPDPKSENFFPPVVRSQHAKRRRDGAANISIL